MLPPNLSISSFARIHKFNISLIQLHCFNLKITYKYFDKLFEFLPDKIIAHRIYFEQENRGFGERAFHSAWYWLLRNYFANSNHINFLEIGVYRGQTLTLLPLIAETIGIRLDSFGLSPMDSSGDDVSLYKNISYIDDIGINAEVFNVSKCINTFKAYSNEAKGIEFIRSKSWDLIYIDGSHDYEIVFSDYKNASEALTYGGVLVFDDSSLFYKKLPRYEGLPGFIGHPGPSRVVEEIPLDNLIHILTVGHLNFFLKLK